MNEVSIVVVAGVYLAALFWIAHFVDHRHFHWLTSPAVGSVIYVLSLAIYCTAWTFFGAAGRAAEAGISYLPTYLGPILIFMVAMPVLKKILLVCKNQNITSISDFIASRYGKCQYLAALVALLALIGVIPYLSLQIKAVAMMFAFAQGYWKTGDVPADPNTSVLGGLDSGLLIALSMALFVMAFATRTADANKQHSGLITSIAFESLVKIVAFVALGIYATYLLLTEPSGSIFNDGLAQILNPNQALSTNFISMTVLSGLAVICLPRQFHVTFIENVETGHLLKSRWLFPLYLLVFAVFVAPIALAGNMLFTGHDISRDAYVLAIPMNSANTALVLTVFIGGLAAATGMIIVEVLSLATMFGNDIALPIILRVKDVATDTTFDARRFVIRTRRIAIFFVIGMAYVFTKVIADDYSLVSIGLISFVAVVQFSPAIIGGIYWLGASRLGAIAGLITGSLIWLYMLLFSSLSEPMWAAPNRDSVLIHPSIIDMNGWVSLDPITQTLAASLLLNIAVFILVSLFSKRTVSESMQAPLFVRPRGSATQPLLAKESTIRIADLRRTLTKFVGPEQATSSLDAYLNASGRSISPNSAASEDTLLWAERLIGGSIGSAMSKNVIASLRQSNDPKFPDAAELLTDATELLSFNWERFKETLENINQGILMFDNDFLLSVWNTRAITLLDLPEHLMVAGTPFEDLVRFNAIRGEYGAEPPQVYVTRALERARQLVEHKFERTRPNGIVLEIFGKPLPSGGFVSTFTDITERKHAEESLQAAYEELESRVEMRTRELAESKDRFREMVESSSDWYWETDALHRFTYVSNRFYEITGLRPEAVIGTTRWELAEQYDSKTHETSLLENKIQMDQHKAFRNIRYTMRIRNDEIVIRASGKPFFSDSGVFMGYRGTASDVTTSEKADQELIRSERLAALGGLVAGVAHEINTPVGIGLTAATYLQEKTSEFQALLAAGQIKKSELNSYVKNAEDLAASLTHNLKRAAHLVKSFKQVAVDQSTDQIRQFNLREYVSEIVTSLGPKLKRMQHPIQIDCPDDLVVSCNPGALSQIFTNLIINSITHAFDDPRTGEIFVLAKVSDKNSLSITYKDNGCGIPSENFRHVFQPFFTTRRGEGGSGLGLHIIYNLVTQSLGGKISFTSSIGQGVKFEIWLPNVVRTCSGVQK